MIFLLAHLFDVGAARDYRVATAPQPVQPPEALPAATLAPVPESRDWRAAHAMLGHPRACRCSTCTLAVTLAVGIRNHQQRN